MKTILHIIDTLGRGGAEVLLLNTIKDLPNYNHYVCYLRGEEDLLEDFQKIVKDVICLKYRNKVSFLQTVFRLRKIISENKIDIIHSHLMLSTFIARFAHGKVPLISTVHNILSHASFNSSKISLIAEKMTYRLQDYMIFVSNSSMQDYKNYMKKLDKNKSTVLYNYVSDEYITKEFVQKRDSEALHVVAVGNLRNQKNYHNILKAFVLLKEFPIFLDVFGAGPLEDELQKFIVKNEIKVTLKGRTSNVLENLKNYNLYLMCSVHEGCPIAPMEAMSYGMPLFFSDIGPLREIAHDKAIYCDPSNPKDIADKLLETFKNWEVFSNESVGNKKWASEKFSKQIYLNKLNNIYSDILNKK